MDGPNDTVDLLSAIERLCDEFETEWRRGAVPEIETYLAQISERGRLPLFEQLLLLELDYRRRRNEMPTAADYLPRFSAFATAVEAALSRMSPSESGPASATTTPTESINDGVPGLKINQDRTSRSPGNGPLSDDSQSAGETTRVLESLADTTIAGRYRLEQIVGEGGMGQVWSAWQFAPVQRRVALKLIKPGMDSRAVIQRFEQERQALALMDHPNIARVLDGGLTVERRPFFVMELVPGSPLTQFCDRERLTIRERLELFVTICQAVQHAHQKGIVHRDLKPSNILVTHSAGRPIPKIIDFGVAKALGGNLTEHPLSTQFGTVVGTLEYMSPEQADSRGVGVDTRTDIYSLGVILYELLTGLRPIDGSRLRRAAHDEMVRVIRDEVPARPSVRLSSHEGSPSLAAVRQVEPSRLTKLLRGDLDWLVMKCLEKECDRRYESASSLARDVQRFLANETVEARPPSTAYRLQKFLKRNQRGVLVSVAVSLAIFAGLAGIAWGQLRAQQARAQAELSRQAAEFQAKTAEQLTDYLVRTFESADPLGWESAGFVGPGERSASLTAKRILDRGADIVNESLKDNPLIRARLLAAMGNSYRNLGQWDTAQRWLLESHQLRQRIQGDQSPDTIDGVQNLAHLARDRGDYVEADRLYRDVISRRQKLYAPNHPLVAETKAYLAWMIFYRPFSNEGAQFNQANLDEAERLLLEVLSIRESEVPRNHRNLGFTNAALASIYLGKTGQEKSVLTYATQAAAHFQQSDQDSSFGAAMLKLILADQHRKAGRYNQAEKSYLEVLSLAREHLGERHPLVLLQLANMAGLYRQMGELPKAEAAIREALELVRPLPALRSQSAIVDALIQYADLVRRHRSEAEAEPIYREALQYARERPSENEANLRTLEDRLKK